MRTSTVLLAIGIGMTGFACVLAWRGQACTPAVFLLTGFACICAGAIQRDGEQ